MGHGYRLDGWPLAASGIVVGLLAEANYGRLPVAELGDSLNNGKVSIIVPARDEEKRVSELLQSLQALDYPSYEVVVVDDASSDHTPDVAREFATTVLSVTDLPDGWTGKAHACWMGASHTTGEWLLFTDADTVHHPDSLSAAVSAAHSRGAGLVSFLCRQRCETFWERLLLPYAYALYFAGRIRVNTSEQSAVANGQYLLIRRTEYERMGGHHAIRQSVVDDVALAQCAFACGVQVALLRGEELVDVRMYDGLPSIWEGLSKNAAHFMVTSPVFGGITVAASLAFLATLVGIAKATSRRQRIALYAAPVLALFPWVRRFGVPSRYVFLYPLAVGAFQLIAFDSIRRSLLRGGVQWKGRRY